MDRRQGGTCTAEVGMATLVGVAAFCSSSSHLPLGQGSQKNMGSFSSDSNKLSTVAPQEEEDDDEESFGTLTNLFPETIPQVNSQGGCLWFWEKTLGVLKKKVVEKIGPSRIK